MGHGPERGPRRSSTPGFQAAFGISGGPAGGPARSQIMNAFSNYSRVCPFERAGFIPPGKNRAQIPHLKQARCWLVSCHRSLPETLTARYRAFFSPVKIRYEISIKKDRISHILFLKNFYNLYHEIADEDTGLST